MKTGEMPVSKQLKLIIEAFLFASDRPINASQINEWLPDDSMADITRALSELQAEYDAMERSFALKEVAKGYQFRTRSEYSSNIIINDHSRTS